MSRLKAWRLFRKDIANEDVEHALEECIKWWRSVPIGVRSIDPYTPDTWPTAWELLYYNDFCEHSRGLGMYYTLWYAGIKDIEMQLVSCNEKCELITIIIVDNKWVLNYNYNTLDTIKDIYTNLEVIEKFNNVPIIKAVLPKDQIVKY